MPLAERFIEIAERATLVAKGDALGAQKLLGHLQYMDMNVVGEQVSKCPRNLQTESGAQVKSLALIWPDIIPPELTRWPQGFPFPQNLDPDGNVFTSFGASRAAS